MDHVNGYSCQCKPGYSDVHCDIGKDLMICTYGLWIHYVVSSANCSSFPVIVVQMLMNVNQSLVNMTVNAWIKSMAMNVNANQDMPGWFVKVVRIQFYHMYII